MTQRTAQVEIILGERRIHLPAPHELDPELWIGQPSIGTGDEDEGLSYALFIAGRVECFYMTIPVLFSLTLTY